MSMFQGLRGVSPTCLPWPATLNRFWRRSDQRHDLAPLTRQSCPPAMQTTEIIRLQHSGERKIIDRDDDDTFRSTAEVRSLRTQHVTPTRNER